MKTENVRGLVTARTALATYRAKSPLGEEWKQTELAYHEIHVFNIDIQLQWDDENFQERSTFFGYTPWTALAFGITECFKIKKNLNLSGSDRLSVVAEFRHEIRPVLNIQKKTSWISDRPEDIYIGSPDELDRIPSFDWFSNYDPDGWTPSQNRLREHTRQSFRCFDSRGSVSLESVAEKVSAIEHQLIAGNATYYNFNEVSADLSWVALGKQDVHDLFQKIEREDGK